MSGSILVGEGCGLSSCRLPEVALPAHVSARRPFLQVAGVAALVFIGAALLAFSLSPAGVVGMAVYTVLPLAWLTTFCSLAGLALASIRY